MMKDIFFKICFKKGSKGAKGDGLNFEVPTNGVIAYDGQDTPEGYEDTTAPEGIVIQPTLETLIVTENGVYTPPIGVDGFDEVDVNVQSSGVEMILDGVKIIGYERTHTTPLGTPLEDGILYLMSLYSDVGDKIYNDLVQSASFSQGTGVTFNHPFNSGNASGYRFAISQTQILAECTSGSWLRNGILCKLSKVNGAQYYRV